MSRLRFSIIFVFFIILLVLFYARYKDNPNVNYVRQLLELKLVTIIQKDSGDAIPKLKMEKYVAHGGGIINGRAITSSVEALNSSYRKGFRFFEVDINWSSDNNLVLIHDWEFACLQLFNVPVKRYPLKEYNKFKMIDNLTQLDLSALADWMENHPEAYIITDVKERNLAALRKISKGYPKLTPRIIPQIYKLYEYRQVKKMGFVNVILTLYVGNYRDNIVEEFVKQFPVAAVTMPVYRTEKLPLKLQKLGVFSYTHTVNDLEVAKSLGNKGIDGFYTDLIDPDLQLTPTRR